MDRVHGATCEFFKGSRDSARITLLRAFITPKGTLLTKSLEPMSGLTQNVSHEEFVNSGFGLQLLNSRHNRIR